MRECDDLQCLRSIILLCRATKKRFVASRKLILALERGGTPIGKCMAMLCDCVVVSLLLSVAHVLVSVLCVCVLVHAVCCMVRSVL